MKIWAAVCAIFLIISFCSCKRKNVPSHECIKLNDKGVDYMMNHFGEKRELLQAVALFKQAISCDSSYVIAYMNLANAYDHLQDYRKELALYRKMLILSNNNPLMVTQKAEVFEKMNMLDSANRAYEIAKQSFEKGLSAHPENINLIDGYTMILALTEGKDAALKELDKRTSGNDELRSKLASEYYFYQDFDKRSYFYQLSQETKKAR